MIALASDFDGTIYFGEKQGFHKKDLDMKYVRVNEIHHLLPATCHWHNC